jgi:hypothetical protein
MISFVVIAVILAIISLVLAIMDGTIKSSTYLIWLAIFCLLLSSAKLTFG